MSESGSGFGLTEVGQISIPVSDLERATSFYREALGMQFLFSTPNMSCLTALGYDSCWPSLKGTSSHRRVPFSTIA